LGLSASTSCPPISGLSANILKASYFVYIVECKDKTLYTGYTANVDKRINEHNFGKRGAKSIKGKLPVSLVYSERFETKSDALKREIAIKGWRREKKLDLIRIKNALSLTP